MFKDLIITEQDAIEGGFTHKATMFGAKCYLKDSDGVQALSVFAFQPARFYADAMYLLSGVFLLFCPVTMYIEVFKNIEPLKNGAQAV